MWMLSTAAAQAMLFKLGFLTGATDESEQCVAGMFAAVDTDGDGRVSFDEFVTLFSLHGESLAAEQAEPTPQGDVADRSG